MGQLKEENVNRIEPELGDIINEQTLYHNPNYKNKQISKLDNILHQINNISDKNNTVDQEILNQNTKITELLTSINTLSERIDSVTKEIEIKQIYGSDSSEYL